MTVGELQRRLQEIDPGTQVVVYREDREADRIELFEVTDASLSTGDPIRIEQSGKASFTFDKDGSATWLFISIVKS
jgi:hypothetical protein